MTEHTVCCTFHNVSPDLANIISSSIGVGTLSKQNNRNSNQLSYSCPPADVQRIRSSLADLLGEHPSIWLSIDNSRHSMRPPLTFDKDFYSIDHLFFGSLFSVERFFVHNTPLDERNHWKMKIFNKQTLVIESESDDSSIRLSVPFKHLHKEVLVIDGEDFSEIIFSYNLINVELRTTNNKKAQKIYGNDPIVQSLNQCTDFFICLSPKAKANLFLDYLQSNHQHKVFYTTIVVQQSLLRWSGKDYDSYRTDHTRYAMAMLHSLGYVFDDKYLHNAILRTLMIELAEKDENYFYQLSLKVLNELKKCHWLNLIECFSSNSSKTTSDHKTSHVCVIHITPTRSLIMPKEKTKGHRAMRYHRFHGINDFCLVYLKPDPPNLYFNDDSSQLMGYFQEIFESGIDLAANHYHLFGASNSQVKEHSFWFIKASSLNEIHQKRQLLGEFDTILNVGTYVARLGLWFSKTDPTNIELTYCATKEEFDGRVKRGEMCVAMIDDVERNNYCFTDGNGLVSKGLAKLIHTKLGDGQRSNVTVPSAYQIRLAGCKGLIVVDPQSTLDQFFIKIRPSMKKFECSDWTLDICGYSRATSSRLNNQFIWLLSDLGVSHRTFLRLQQRWFKKKPSRTNCVELINCLISPYQLLPILTELNVPTLVCFQLNPVRNRLKQKRKIGIMRTSDSIFPNITEAFRDCFDECHWTFSDLLKNKIPLPVNECRYIYGCALESQLQEGQCFIRYQILNENGKTCPNPKFECVRGRVIVSKNPCPYAGDMLELWAVDLPELYHLNDVIVFSVQGERPDFNKIAGSDLDGDGYFVYWGEELRLRSQVEPLDYTPEEKKYQSTPICPQDVIRYCLSTLTMTSSGEIYNLHAIIVDKNFENHSQRTCQPLAIELARMFSSAVDSGKTGYIIDKQYIKKIREKYGQKYPDFLGKDDKRSYPSESIVGILYRNACNYIKGNVDKVEEVFTQFKTDENDQLCTMHVIPPSKPKLDPPKKTHPAIDQVIQLHPGSPLSSIQNSISSSNDSSLIIHNQIPTQFFLIDGMISSSAPIKLRSSTKPFYSDHAELIRLRVELEPLSNDNAKPCLPSLSSVFFEQISSCQYSAHDTGLVQMTVSFGYIYLLKYSDRLPHRNQHPKTLDLLVNNHFLPPLFDTFFPSTILERIEVTENNADCLQQIFYKLNHTIKREYIESNSNSICLVFPWVKMNFIEHQREIILICLNTESGRETRVHFDKNGQIQSIDDLPKIFFKCYHQQTSSYRPDILYELRSFSRVATHDYSRIFKHQTLLDPTHPLTLPFNEHIIPVISYSVISNVFRYDNIEIRIVRTFTPIHYKNDDFYQLRCILGYFEQAEHEHSVEIRVDINKTEKLSREKLRYIMTLATELSQMLD